MKEHKKLVSETGVKSDPAFCLGPYIEITNSDPSFSVSALDLKVQQKRNTDYLKSTPVRNRAVVRTRSSTL